LAYAPILTGWLEKGPNLSECSHLVLEQGTLYYLAAAGYPISLLHTAVIAFIMFSLSHDFKPDLL